MSVAINTALALIIVSLCTTTAMIISNPILAKECLDEVFSFKLEKITESNYCESISTFKKKCCEVNIIVLYLLLAGLIYGYLYMFRSLK